MKKIIFTLLLFSFSLAHAEWVQVGKNKDGLIYLDYSSINKNGINKKAWTLVIFNEPKPLPNAPAILSTKAYDEFDCKNLETRQLTFIAYSDKESNNQILINNDKDKFQPVVPDSSWAKVLKAVCKY